MPKASEVASELRKIADSLDNNPDAEIQQAWVSFYCDTKDRFVATASALPRPLKKSEREANDAHFARISLGYKNAAIQVDASVYKSLTCELVEPARPAVYRCDPILSLVEEAEVTR